MTEMLRIVIDRLVAAIALALLSPILLVAAIAIVWGDGFPIFYRQKRIGLHGRPFWCLKFRSMRNANTGTSITASADPRITAVGAVLRAYKLDELPQLLNVVRGEMSLIGPRPEVPLFVDTKDPLWRCVLSVRPGLSDLASLVYRHEERVLAGASDPEKLYRSEVLPRKLRLSTFYIQNRSAARDLKLLLLTARYSFLPVGFEPQRVLRSFSYTEEP
ncbi:MAG TPA: sugar transferase [Bryobacteraceae bacterium]|nr:sugar transferase [Bryobacteraceae bacterium]